MGNPITCQDSRIKQLEGAKIYIDAAIEDDKAGCYCAAKARLSMAVSILVLRQDEYAMALGETKDENPDS